MTRRLSSARMLIATGLVATAGFATLRGQPARTTQLQGDETAAQHALTTEQQRWADFNDRLEALERTLGATAVPPR